jgi:hypothetical protein
VVKKLINVLLIILILLVTFFGLGPVLFADGTNIDRMFTLVVVLVLYLLIFGAFYINNRRMKNK